MSHVVQFVAALLLLGEFSAYALGPRARADEAPPAAGGGGLSRAVSEPKDKTKDPADADAQPPRAGGGGLMGAARGGLLGGGGAARARTLEEAALAHGLQVPADRNIEVALRRPTKFDFADTPLSDVVDFFANQFDINIQLDNKGLADAAVDPSAPITRSLRKAISFESALRLILDDLDLTFVIQYEVLKITSKEKADEILTTKVYPVGDLLGGRRNWGPLMNTIKATIQPDAWDDNGGPGSIQPFIVGSLLVISQKRDVHDEVRDLLAQLRAELPRDAAGAEKTAGQTTTTAVYHLGGTSAEETAEALKKLVAPQSWEGQGGKGAIFAISRIHSAVPGQAGPQTTSALLIQQTAEVQNEIQDLLRELVPPLGMGRKGAMVGAFGGGMGGMGGGVGGAAPAAAAVPQPAAEAEKAD